MMSVFGVTMVKDEEDIIGSVVAHMLSQVDHVIVADNLSTDRTREILDGLSCPQLTVVDDLDPAYYQSKKVTALAHHAGEMGAKYIIPFDADEIWYSPFGTVRDVLSGLPSEWLVISADLYDHVPTDIDDQSVVDPVERIGWRRKEPGALPKVACQYQPDLVVEQGNHSVTYSHRPAILGGQLVVRHFPYRSREQMVRKAMNGASALESTTLGEESGAHWRGYSRIVKTDGEQALWAVFDEWFSVRHPYDRDDLIYDPAYAAVPGGGTESSNK